MVCHGLSTLRMRPRFALLACLLSGVLLLSSCLTRRNALPPSSTHGSTYKKPERSRRASERILTDATKAPRDVAVSANLLESYAEVLGVDADELATPRLYELIDQWMGVPHRLGGTDQRGMDCSAFVGMVMKDVYGKMLPRSSRDMAQKIKRKYERQLKEGDLVFFSFGKRDIDHVGIYLNNSKFVHVSTSRGVIISDLKDTWYYRYFTRAGTVM